MPSLSRSNEQGVVTVPTKRAVGNDHELRHQESESPFVPGGAILGCEPAPNDDVYRSQIVLAIR